MHPHHKIADSLRLWALSVLCIHQHWRTSQALRTPPPHTNCGTSQALCSPMMKFADSLRLCAPPSRKLGDVSGSAHPHDENCRQPQALCAPHDENCRQAQALSTPPHENWGTSQAACTPIVKSPTVSGSGHFRCSPLNKSAGRLRRSSTPMMKSPRVSGFECSAHENCGVSQAVCSPMMKIADSLRLCAPPLHEKWGTSQALCTPIMRIADSLRL